MAFVSIILPVYNGEKYLRKALQSVKDQTFKDWECIIVDDCSTDKSPEIINEFLEDNRFSLVRTPKNLGFPGSSRNVGLQNAKGQWIGFLDQDDILT